jgi:hypothetical protein
MEPITLSVCQTYFADGGTADYCGAPEEYNTPSLLWEFYQTLLAIYQQEMAAKIWQLIKIYEQGGAG